MGEAVAGFFGAVRGALLLVASILAILWFVSPRARAFAAKVPAWVPALGAVAVAAYGVTSVLMLATADPQSRASARAVGATLMGLAVVPLVLWLFRRNGGPAAARLRWQFLVAFVAVVPLWALSIWLTAALLPSTADRPLHLWGAASLALFGSLTMAAVMLPSMLYIRSAQAPLLSYAYGIAAVCIHLPFQPVVSVAIGLMTLGGLPRISRTIAST